MKIYKNVEQGTDEWHKLREDKLTASHAQAISAQGAGLKTYISNKVIGLFSEGSKDRFYGSEMERGHIDEPIARMLYEFETGKEVQEVGFIEMSKNVGFSPDGLVDEDGLIEIKSRNDKIYFDLLITGKIDTKTLWQMEMALLISGREYCDFVAYNKNFKENPIFIKRVYPDEKKKTKLMDGLRIGVKLFKDLKKNEIIQQEINSKKNQNE